MSGLYDLRVEALLAAVPKGSPAHRALETLERVENVMPKEKRREEPSLVISDGSGPFYVEDFDAYVSPLPPHRRMRVEARTGKLPEFDWERG